MRSSRMDGSPGGHDLSFRFTLDDLRQVRQAALVWARQAGLSEARAADFMLALNEITTNAVRHGSPAATLWLRGTGQSGVRAEVTDSGRWHASNGPGHGQDSSHGLGLVRLLCEQVTIDPSPGGTTVMLQMGGPSADQVLGGAVPEEICPVRWTGRSAVIALPGEIDTINCGQIGAVLDQALAEGAAVLVADMTATWFCASEGIRVLVLAHRAAQRAGAQLRVAAPGPRICHLFELTGTTDLLDTYPSLEAALDGQRKRR